MPKTCCVCGATRNIENAHYAEKGMGGLGSKAAPERDLTFPLCAGKGSGNLDINSCHGADHNGDLKKRLDPDGKLMFCVNERYARVLRRRGVHVRDGIWYHAKFADYDFDAVDAPDTYELDESAAEQEAAMTAAERELLEAAQYAGASGYYLAESIRKVMASYADPDAGMDAVDAVLKGRLKPSQVTRYKAWASLPDTPGVKAMGLTRAYAVARTFTDHDSRVPVLVTAEAAADPDDPYTWKQWDYDVLGKVPSDELPKVECPLGAGACARAAKEG